MERAEKGKKWMTILFNKLIERCEVVKYIVQRRLRWWDPTRVPSEITKYNACLQWSNFVSIWVKAYHKVFWENVRKKSNAGGAFVLLYWWRLQTLGSGRIFLFQASAAFIIDYTLWLQAQSQFRRTRPWMVEKKYLYYKDNQEDDRKLSSRKYDAVGALDVEIWLIRR